MARKNLNRGLGALAALGALSYHLSRGSSRTDGGAPVGDRSTPVAPQDARLEFNDDSEPGGSTYRLLGAAGPVAVRPAAGPTARPPVGPDYNVIGTQQDAETRARRQAGPVIPAGSPSYYDPRMANLSSAAVGRGEADAIRNAANAQRPLRAQLTDTTLGVSTGPAPGAPSIYAGPEAWRLYNQQKAAEAAAAGPSAPQGSARNIRQQMREKDKEVLAAVRRRQEEEAKTKQTAREADAERLREARRVQRPASNTADLRFRDMQKRMGLKKGGATKKMASGGMTSASKRGDGIASKGKTKCKMY